MPLQQRVCGWVVSGEWCMPGTTPHRTKCCESSPHLHLWIQCSAAKSVELAGGSQRDRYPRPISLHRSTSPGWCDDRVKWSFEMQILSRIFQHCTALCSVRVNTSSPPPSEVLFLLFREWLCCWTQVISNGERVSLCEIYCQFNKEIPWIVQKCQINCYSCNRERVGVQNIFRFLKLPPLVMSAVLHSVTIIIAVVPAVVAVASSVIECVGAAPVQRGRWR